MDKNKSKSAATASRIRFRFPDEAPVGAAIGKFRWVICTLLFLGISKNSMDRQVLGVLKTTWQHNLGGMKSTTATWCSCSRRPMRQAW
jgi:hypothetical protein